MLKTGGCMIKKHPYFTVRIPIGIGDWSIFWQVIFPWIFEAVGK